MLNIYYGDINIFNPIEGKLNYFIEAYVNVFGEKYRKQITTNLTNAKYIFCGVNDILVGEMLEQKREEELKQEYDFLCDVYGITTQNIIFKNDITDLNSFLKQNKQNIGELAPILFYCGVANNQNLTNKQILELILLGENKEKLNHAVNALISEKHKVKEKVYNKYHNSLQLLDQNDIALAKIDTKYNDQKIEFLKNIIQHIRDKQKISAAISDDELLELSAIYADILDLGKEKLTKRVELLSKEKQQAYEKLFLSLGAKKCDDFKKYIHNLKIITLIFGEFITNKMNEIDFCHSQEYKKMDAFAIDAGREIMHIDFLDDNNYYVEEVKSFTQDEADYSACVMGFMDVNKNFNSLCLCKNACELQLSDLIHEMGHIIDTTFLKLDGNECYFKSGFMLGYNILFPDEITLEESDEPYKIDKSLLEDYDMLNEVINDYLAIKVKNEFEKYGQKFVFGKERERDSIYQYAFDVIADFIEHHQEKLIECKMANNFDLIDKYFGKKNFKHLAKIIQEYVSRATDFENLLEANPNNQFIKNKYEELTKSTKKSIDAIEQAIIQKNLKSNNKELNKVI